MARTRRSARKPFLQLTRAERGIIQRLLKAKVRVREIATMLGKDRSTIYRELRRNRNVLGHYLEDHAQSFLKKRRLHARSKFLRIENDGLLERQIEGLLRFGLSPEQIAGFLKRTQQAQALSRSTLYRWVSRRWQGRKQLLRMRGRPRLPYGSRKRAWDPHKRHIKDRPGLVRRRMRVGDWEADLVHGTQDDSRHCLLTLNDRATGFCIIRKLGSHNSGAVATAMVTALRDHPVKTITCDNGTEFGRHLIIERMLHCQVYFTDTRSPQQRGSNENLNGLLRQYFPKGRSMRHVTQLHVSEAAQRLNARPRKRYGYRSPRQVFSEMTGRSLLFLR